MSYLVLDGFPKGLDVRRFSLAPQPGSLVELSNGHLTNGGEIEKRKAFVLYANVAITETGAKLTTGVRTFGMQETGVGLTVFGSAIEYFTAATVTRATAANVATLNIGTHTLRAGDLVTITGIAGYTATNVALISATSPNITYANVHANEGTTADVTGTVVLTAPTLSRPVLASAMPAGVTYQQLQHPAVADGETYVAASHAMTAVLSSTSYAGLIFALATFADGNTFGYYDGTLVRDFTDGLIMAHLNTNTKIATAIKEMVNRSERYTATNPSVNVARVTGPLGLYFGTSASDDSAGTLTASKVSDPTIGTAARRAIGSFRVIAGSNSAGVNEITNIEVGPSGGAFTSIMTAADVDWTNSNEFTAALLAASINTAAVAGYTAEANGDTVTIKALESDGDASNNYVVRVTAAGDVCIGKVQFQIQLAVAFNITALMINGIDQLVDTGGGDLNEAVTNVATAATNIAAIINANTTAGLARGYLANATGAVISISKAVTRSDDPDLPAYFVHSATAGSGSGVFEVGTDDGGVTGMTANIVAGGFVITNVSGSVGGNSRYTGYWPVSLIVSGGLPPYQSPVWYGGIVSSVSSTQFRISVVNAFLGYSYNQVLAALPPHVYCEIIDASLTTVRSNTL